MQMKKFVLKLDIYDDRDKRKAFKTVSTLSGIDSISMDMKGKKLTVIGTVDPVSAVSKLRKFCQADIISVGPAKEPEKEKKEEPKKEEPKKEEPKKEEPKEEPKKEEPKEEPKKEEPKKEEPKKEEPKKEEQEKKEEKKAEPEPPVIGMVMPYRPYYPPVNTYYHHSMEENPNACVIC